MTASTHERRQSAPHLTVAALLLLGDLARHRRTPTGRDLQQTGAAVLDRLLTADLPAVGWHLDSTSPDPELLLINPRTFPILDGQADSHAAVRAWAAHLGTEVGLDHGITPSTRAVIAGIGVRVWCAPAYRDDAGPEAVTAPGEEVA